MSTEADNAPTEAAAPLDARADALAAFMSMDDDAPAPADDEAPEPAAEEAPEGTDEAEAADDPEDETAPEPANDEAEEEDAEDADEAPAEDAEPEVKADDDPELSKRLEAIQRAEKRGKEAVAKERQAFEAERAQFLEEWQPKIQAAQQFEQLKARARYDAAAVLEALGYGDDDFEPAARQLYVRSQGAKADPKHREAAARMMREREQQDALSQMRQEMEKLRSEIQQRDLREQQQQQVETYLTSVTNAVTDDTPLVRTWLDKSPQKVRRQIVAVSERLIAETGEVPDAADVLQALEQERRSELEELGIDFTQVAKKKATTPKKKTPAAGEKRTANKTLTNDLGNPTKPRGQPVTREELEADVIANMPSLS